MEKIAKFEKVGFDEYKKAFEGRSDDEIKEIYDGISLPRRATKGSAGYDFYAPCDVTLAAGESVKIPTGIRVKIADGWVLALFPRSGLGFKFRLQLDNTVGIIDADYYESDNQGHIFCKITNDSRENKTMSVKKGNGFCQGIFLPFGITTDDETTAERNGGFGSTDK
ncbi:MAG: dUTP diphosphatase [Christensenellales bacterium]